MLMQEKISAPDTPLKLSIAIDEGLKALRPQLQAKHLPRDPRGGTLGCVPIWYLLSFILGD